MSQKYKKVGKTDHYQTVFPTLSVFLIYILQTSRVISMHNFIFLVQNTSKVEPRAELVLFVPY